MRYTVIADINILCVGQAKPSACTLTDTQSEVFRRGVLNTPVYCDRYRRLKNVRGVWYQLYPKARDDGDYFREFLDIESAGEKKRVVFLNDRFKTELADFIGELYAASPKKSLYFFIDLQGYKELSCELTLDEALELLKSEDIYFNTVYRIT